MSIYVFQFTWVCAICIQKNATKVYLLSTGSSISFLICMCICMCTLQKKPFSYFVDAITKGQNWVKSWEIETQK